jgi:hypothetical protein
VIFLKILGGILALGIGLYMGAVGRYRPDPEELEKALSEVSGSSRKVKQRFTPLAWLRQGQERSSHIRRRSRGTSSHRFNLIPPESKDD